MKKLYNFKTILLVFSVTILSPPPSAFCGLFDSLFGTPIHVQEVPSSPESSSVNPQTSTTDMNLNPTSAHPPEPIINTRTSCPGTSCGFQKTKMPATCTNGTPVDIRPVNAGSCNSDDIPDPEDIFKAVATCRIGGSQFDLNGVLSTYTNHKQLDGCTFFIPLDTVSALNRALINAEETMNELQRVWDDVKTNYGNDVLSSKREDLENTKKFIEKSHNNPSALQKYKDSLTQDRANANEKLQVIDNKKTELSRIVQKQSANRFAQTFYNAINEQIGQNRQGWANLVASYDQLLKNISAMMGAA